MSSNTQKFHDYTIKIISGDGSTTRSIHLTAKLLQYGLVSLIILVLLLLAGFCFAGYTFFSNKVNQQTILQLQKANTIQQEQLTDLAQKASKMQDTLNKLTSTENELKSIANINIQPTDNVDKLGKGGQGGPWIAPNTQNLSEVLSNIQKQMTVHQKNLEDLRQALMVKHNEQETAVKKAYTIPLGWPAKGTITSPYGFRWNGTDFHPGIDIANNYGTPIRATADGIITAAGWNSGGYGNMVDINHGHGVMTRYGHASSVVVSVGQHVQRGQIIAYMGSTGFSTGPHVHYEVRINGRPVNPAGYL
ncbi:M23 family metallopeptidase [Pectinatus sottacetonis]|uniref:M23 family metallopeptidase n=1 Tax=Pectinatus sottacetonis TaxID=1002795 RepID=UPI0018C767D4|nr:M23 family metallopeptidase [Pectinatus sottacetonis]